MSLEPSALPAALNPLEDWVLYGFSQPDPVDRLLALELAGDFTDERILEPVRILSRSDSDPYCRMAARTLSQRQSVMQRAREWAAGDIDLSPQAIGTVCEHEDPYLRVALLLVLRRRPPAETLDLWRSFLAASSKSPLAVVGLTLLARYGASSDADVAVRFLQSADHEAVKAALELLKNHAPQKFREVICQVVEKAGADVRFHALRLLRSLDLDAALECLRECVRDADPVSRLKAVRELALLPFEHTEVLLLDVMGCENRLLILVAASICMAVNPSPELPLKLYDMCALSRGEKQQVLKMLLHLCVGTLQASGLLKVEVQEYLAQLQQQIRLRKHELQKRFMLRNLTDSDPNTRLTAIRWLQDHTDDTEVVKALQERSRQEDDLDCRALYETILETSTPTVESAASATHAAVEPTPQQELHDIEARLKTGALSERERLRLRELFDREGQKPLQIQIARLIAQYGTVEDIPWLRALLGHQSPAVIAEAIRGIARLDLDTLLHTMNRWLTHSDPRIRRAGLEVYLQHDKEQALGYIRHMIDSPQTAGRKAAVALLLMLDYSTAEPFLIRMYAQEARSGLKDQVAAILSSNPSMQGLMALYEGTHDAGEVRDDDKSTWTTALANAEKVMKRPAGLLEQECARRYAQQRETWRAATTRAVRPAVPLIRAPVEPPLPSNDLSRVLESLKNPDYRAIGFSAIVVIVIWFGWLLLSPRSMDDAPPHTEDVSAPVQSSAKRLTTGEAVSVDQQREIYLKGLYKRD